MAPDTTLSGAPTTPADPTRPASGPAKSAARRPVDIHVITALIMVVIASLGASTAYWAALSEQTNRGLEQRLTLWRLQDITFRQKFVAENLFKIGLENQETVLTNEADELSAAAAGGNGQGADWQYLHSTLLRLEEKALRRFTQPLRSFENSRESTELQLAKKAKTFVEQSGAMAAVDEAQQPTLRFPLLEGDIKAADRNVPKLALCVVFFVLGLVMLTLAEIYSSLRWLWLVFTVLGVLSASGASYYALQLAPSAIGMFAMIGVLAATVAAAGGYGGLFAETSDDHHAAHNEPPEPKTLMGTPSGREAHDVWSRAMILLISGAVLASAATGFLQSRAQSRSDHFALKAHDSQFEFVNRRTRLTAVALGGGLDVPAQMVSIRLRCATATQIAQLAKDQKINGDVAKLDAERARLCDRYDEFRKKDAIAIDVSDAHDLLDSLDDPSQALIDNVLDGKGRSPDAVLARADGLLEIADGWDAKASLFLAVLTTLAIAIYLFGQAHAMGSSRPGQWLVGGGLALFLVSAGLAAWAIALPILPSPKLTGVANCVSESAALSDPVKIIETAAEAYGDGLAQIHLVANSPPGSQDQAKAHDAALDALRCASRLRPSFHLAVSEYDDELRNYRSPQKGDSFISLIGRSEIDEHVKLQRQSLSILNARGLHRSASQVSDFAYDSMIAAIVSGDREGLGAARRLLSLVNGRASAFERFSVRWLEPDLFVEPESLDDPINLLNLGLAELASGEPGLMEAARADYRRGLGGLPAWQKTPAKKAKFLASALIDLEILRAYCGHLHPAATCQTIAQAMDLIAPNIAAGVWYDEPPSSKASATDFQARVSPYSFGWSAKVDDFDPAKDRLTVAWFRDERAARGTADDPARWQLLRALPSWLELYGGPAGQDGKGVIPDNSASRAGSSQDSLSDTHTCNGGGNYVAQLFLNGRLIATQTVTLADFDLTSFRTRELDSEWCIPRGWQDWSSTETGHPWFADRPVRGFKNFVGDHDRFDGALMSFFMPTAMPDSEKSDYALHRALQILLKKGDPREQGASSTATLWSQDIEDRLAANAIRHGSLTDRQCEQADTIDHPMYKVIMDKGGGTLVRIGVVDGHLPFNQACTILASMRPYFTD